MQIIATIHLQEDKKKQEKNKELLNIQEKQ